MIPSGAARPPFPAPGDSVYVHVSQRMDPTGRIVSEESDREIPAERSQVRAYLTPREKGGWAGVFPHWFELTNDRLVDANPADPAPGIPESSTAGTGKSSLGMTTEVIKVQGRVALRVASVERGGPAQKCGLEVGDIIAGADGAKITDAQQLDALGAKGKKFSLVVIDVNTGRVRRSISIPPRQRSRPRIQAHGPFRRRRFRSACRLIRYLSACVPH